MSLTLPKSSLSWLKVSVAGGTLFLLSALWTLWQLSTLALIMPCKESEVIFYNNRCGDALDQLFLHALKRAKRSIDLWSYTLTDPHLIRTLSERAEEGVEVRILFDAGTPQKIFKQLSSKIVKVKCKTKGLMHKKILITDRKRAWIGSANFTPTSLKVYDNLVIGLYSREIAETLLAYTPFSSSPPPCPSLFHLKQQSIEFCSFPEEEVEGFKRLINLISSAQSSLQIALFTWTHPQITEKVIEAAGRGVKVEALIDGNSGYGVSQKTVAALQQAGISVRLGSFAELLHHKMVLIDQKILISGSANWTRAAFTKNSDSFLVCHNLTESQSKKLKKLWYRLRTQCRAPKMVTSKNSH